MGILAKSIIDNTQIESRKSLPVDGIEILLLEKDFQNYKETKEDLIKIAEAYQSNYKHSLQTKLRIFMADINDKVMGAVKEKEREGLLKKVNSGQ